MAASGGVGIRVKSGWGALVVVRGPPAAPALLVCRELTLSDPAEGHTRHPYHADQKTLERDAAVLERRLARIREITRASAASLLADPALAGLRPTITLVAGSLRDPDTVTSEHMRAHAHEGRVFWAILRECLAELGVVCAVLAEREVPATVGARLGLGAPALKECVAALGRQVRTGWRAEQKLAAMAALYGLASPPAGPG